MSERLQRVQDRLQVGLVEARVTHPYSLRIAEAHQFAVVGFLPQRWRLRERESLALLVRYFGNALELRNNHPRIIPEIHPLAHLALENCSLPPDAIVDEDAPAYPPGGDFEVQELTTEGYAALLRIERGRVRHREIFGPVRLHYGIFKLHARRSRYLIAREDGRIAGAVGFTLDPVDKAVRIFELIALHDEVIRFLLSDLERACREKWDCLIEVDVSAHAPRMQRTLLELGFLPVAYLPALVFHEVERLDVVKMVRLLTPPQVSTDGLTPSCEALADLVLRLFPQPEGASPDCQGRPRLAALRRAERRAGRSAGRSVRRHHVRAGGDSLPRRQGRQPDARRAPGRDGDHRGGLGRHRWAWCGAENAWERCRSSPRRAHSATATALTRVETAVLGHQDLAELIRLRPDIGLHIYRNLAVGMGEKLKRLDVSLAAR